MSAREAYCSISTPSHLAQTLACLRSLQEHQPGCTIVLLLFSVASTPLPDLGLGGIMLRRVEDCLDSELIREMRSRYSVQELCFALKPFLIRSLLHDGFKQVHYLDGDCRVYGSLAPLTEALDSADILLTPHYLTALPDDGCTPAALTLLRGGVFNGGYIGVSNTVAGRAFADWLSAMTRDQGRNAPQLGMCGDQRWLDLAPALFPGTAICRSEAANVAYWNLHERHLEGDAWTGFLVNGQPLLFFHFSGYSTHRPLELSSHQNRHRVEAGSSLLALLDDYRACVGSPFPESPTPRAPRMARWLRRLA